MLFASESEDVVGVAGTNVLRQQVVAGLTEDQIRESWQKDLAAYREMRKKYVLYP